MVGLQTLDLAIGVRVPASQPTSAKYLSFLPIDIQGYVVITYLQQVTRFALIPSASPISSP
jgi:hypothetical protein